MGTNLGRTRKGEREKKILLNFQKTRFLGKLDFPLSRADSGLCVCVAIKIKVQQIYQRRSKAW